MKKLLVLSAIAALTAACGGSDNKPATDPTTAAPAATDASNTTTEAAPADTSAAPASTDAAKPADPEKK